MDIYRKRYRLLLICFFFIVVNVFAIDSNIPRLKREIILALKKYPKNQRKDLLDKMLKYFSSLPHDVLEVFNYKMNNQLIISDYQVKIDGKKSEWENIKRALIDEKNDQNVNKQGDILSLRVVWAKENLFFLIERSSLFSDNAGFLLSFETDDKSLSLGLNWKGENLIFTPDNSLPFNGAVSGKDIEGGLPITLLGYPNYIHIYLTSWQMKPYRFSDGMNSYLTIGALPLKHRIELLLYLLDNHLLNEMGYFPLALSTIIEPLFSISEAKLKQLLLEEIMKKLLVILDISQRQEALSFSFNIKNMEYTYLVFTMFNDYITAFDGKPKSVSKMCSLTYPSAAYDIQFISAVRMQKIINLVFNLIENDFSNRVNKNKKLKPSEMDEQYIYTNLKKWLDNNWMVDKINSSLSYRNVFFKDGAMHSGLQLEYYFENGYFYNGDSGDRAIVLSLLLNAVGIPSFVYSFRKDKKYYYFCGYIDIKTGELHFSDNGIEKDIEKIFGVNKDKKEQNKIALNIIVPPFKNINYFFKYQPDPKKDFFKTNNSVAYFDTKKNIIKQTKGLKISDLIKKIFHED